MQSDCCWEPMKSHSFARERSTLPGLQSAVSRTSSKEVLLLPAVTVMSRASQDATASLPAAVSFSVTDFFSVFLPPFAGPCRPCRPCRPSFFFLGLSVTFFVLTSGLAAGSSNVVEVAATLVLTFFFDLTETLTLRPLPSRAS